MSIDSLCLRLFDEYSYFIERLYIIGKQYCKESLELYLEGYTSNPLKEEQ